MGMFASLSGVIGKSQEEVVISLRNYALSVSGGLVPEQLDAEHKNRCTIESANGNTTIYYPHHYMEWDESSAFLSKELNAPVFSFHIHDGDLWMYTFYVNGEAVDQFNPIPDYWDENIGEEEINQWKGDAVTLARYIPGLDPGTIQRYLIRWDLENEGEKAYEDDEYINEDWQLLDFMRKVGLTYPMRDDELPSGDPFKLWTRQLGLETASKSESSRVQGKVSLNKKPWWKFWHRGVGLFAFFGTGLEIALSYSQQIHL